jgi:hypothetical protein
MLTLLQIAFGMGIDKADGMSIAMNCAGPAKSMMPSSVCNTSHPTEVIGWVRTFSVRSELDWKSTVFSDTIRRRAGLDVMASRQTAFCVRHSIQSIR